MQIAPLHTGRMTIVGIVQNDHLPVSGTGLVDPETGRKGRRETNTMPQWAGSCWYYLRYMDPKNSDEAWSKQAENYWMPVDLYVGGAEHAVMHLLYARFWTKVMADAGLIAFREPFPRLRSQGVMHARGTTCIAVAPCERLYSESRW